MHKLYMWNFGQDESTFPIIFWAMAKSKTEALEMVERRYPKNFNLISSREPEVIMRDAVGCMVTPAPKLTREEKLELLEELNAS